MTLVVNLYGGPGSGKSTTAARVFSDLKAQGVEAELATEYAKDLTWENRARTLSFQPYVTATQMWRVARLMGQVDVVITDSPILLALLYHGEGYPIDSFDRFVIETHNSWETMNFLIERHPSKPYHERGRNQTIEEAQELDRRTERLLNDLGVRYYSEYGPPAPTLWITERIRHKLGQAKEGA